MDIHICDNLHMASHRGHKQCIITLLDRGADIHTKDNYNNTPHAGAPLTGSLCIT